MLGVALLLVLLVTCEPMTPHLTPFGRFVLRAVLALILLGASAAQAQEVDLGLAVARACWSEGGLNSDETGQCHALFRSLVNKSAYRGIPLAVHIRQYCPLSQTPTRTDSRRWLADLWRDGREPAGWENVRGRDGRPLPWRNSRGAWLELVAYADRLVRNPWMDINPCWYNVEPIDWGTEPAVSNYLQRNQRAVVVYCSPLPMCGGPGNVFLRPQP